jgi:hypothetical protein
MTFLRKLLNISPEIRHRLEVVDRYTEMLEAALRTHDYTRKTEQLAKDHEEYQAAVKRLKKARKKAKRDGNG